MTTLELSPADLRPATAGDATHRVAGAKSAAGTRLRAGWPAVLVIAAVVTFADGFWLTSLQGAVGAIQRNQPPVQRWLRDSTLMLPLFVIGVLAALAIARRVVRPGWPEALKVAVAAVVIAAATSVVGFGEVATSAAYDYAIQSQTLAAVHATHGGAVTVPFGTTVRNASDAVPVASSASCTVVCSQRAETLHTHLRALRSAAVVLVASNVVLVAWVLALFGWTLSGRRRSPRPIHRSRFAAAGQS